ncbi:MAG: DUF5666 domain-containing protein [Patescibacteria group bacterium]|jgi:hypothetical protein
MKKIVTVVLSLTMLSPALGTPAMAAKPVEIQERKEAREDVRVQIQTLKKEEKEARKDFRETFKEKREAVWAKLRAMFPKILPAGINEGEVTEVSGNTLMVKHDGKSITLKVTDKTQILKKYGGKIVLSEIKVGHVVSARGTWQDKTKAVLEVRVLRDLSLERRPATFWGKIKSIAENKESFVLEVGKRGDLTVLVDRGTKTVNRSSKEVDFSVLAVGHRVRVSGMWDGEKTLDETRTIKDWSIGPVVEVTPIATSSATR